MTGEQIKRIRCALRMDHARFAQLLGVHPSTAYRWELATEPRVEPFQLQILTVLDQQITARKTAQEQYELGKTIVTGILIGGGLFGLFKLLDDAFGDDRRRSGGAAPVRSKRARSASSPSKGRRRA